HVDRERRASQEFEHDATTLVPRRHESEDGKPDNYRYPSAVKNLECIRSKKREVDDQEEHCKRNRVKEAPVPSRSCEHVKQDGRDRHRSGDSNTVSCAECAGGSESKNDEQ